MENLLVEVEACEGQLEVVEAVVELHRVEAEAVDTSHLAVEEAVVEVVVLEQ